MKKILLLLTTFCTLTFMAFAQNRPNNAVQPPAVVNNNTPPAVVTIGKVNTMQVTTALAPYQSVSNLNNAPIGQKQVTTTYSDGLGRPIQVVQNKASASSSDVVIPMEYGQYAKTYLPYTVNAGNTSGEFRENAMQEQYQFYHNPNDLIADTGYPYSETVLDNSPLMTPLAEYGPGENWRKGSNHGTSSTYRPNLNSTDGIVRRWSSMSSYPASSTTYGERQLMVTETTDGNGAKTKTYTDEHGRVIVKKTLLRTVNATAEYLSTYFVYNDLGRLCFVIPPEAVYAMEKANNWNMCSDQTFRDKWLYCYTYDERGRTITEKVPAAGWRYFLYDVRDRLVGVQDGNLRVQNKWRFIKYDALNRPLMTGVAVNQTSLNTLRNQVRDMGPVSEAKQNGSVGYTLNQTFPTNATTTDLRTVVYYDNYQFPHVAEVVFSGGINVPLVNNRVTGTLVKDLNKQEWLRSVFYYDRKGRLTLAETNRQGKQELDSYTVQYSFDGKVLSTTDIRNTIPYLRIKEDFTYNTAGMLTKRTHTILDNGQVKSQEVLATYEYDELGRPIRKYMGGESHNSIDWANYTYNVRGWLTGINSITDAERLFGMELYYDHGFDQVNYNGNVSGTKLTMDGSYYNRAYGYRYDTLGRLKAADYIAQFKDNPAQWNQQTNRYTVDELTYDRNGNTKTMRRVGARDNMASVIGSIDRLTYTYDGNRLMNVSDAAPETATTFDFEELAEGAGTEYQYDANGNMISDANKGITITYNDLNLPMQITKGEDIIRYTYDAAGNKLTATITENGEVKQITTYDRGIERERVDPDTYLVTIPTAEGRVVLTQKTDLPISGLRYEYFHRDHLGNVCTVFARPLTVTYETDFEAPTEEFENFSSTSFNLMDHTDPGWTATHAQLLHGGHNSQVGLAKSIKVHPDDRITVQVYARYEAPGNTPGNLVGFAAALTSAFQLAPGPGEMGAAYTALNNYGALVAGGNSKGGGDQAPKAYLNILVFNNNFELITAAYQKISTTGANAHELLSRTVTITEPGFVYIYLSNENPTVANVYFDDVTVSHVGGKVYQKDYYYPGGMRLPALSYSRPEFKDNKHLYQGKEQQAVSEWHDFGARQYDAQLNRWHGVDPVAGSYPSWSPYNAMLNNPMRYTDPTGMWPEERHAKYIPDNPMRGSNDDEPGMWLGDEDYDANHDGRPDWMQRRAAAISEYGSAAGFNQNSWASFGHQMLAAERAVGRGNYSYANGQFYYYSANQVELFRSSWKNGNQYGVDIYYGTQYQKQILGSGSGGGTATSFSFGFALGFGISGEWGVVTDETGASKKYYTVSANFGLGLDIGLNNKEIIPNNGSRFRVNQYEGKGKNLSMGAFFTAESRGGNTDNDFNGFGVDYKERSNSLSPLFGIPIPSGIGDVGILYQLSKTSFYK